MEMWIRGNGWKCGVGIRGVESIELRELACASWLGILDVKLFVLRSNPRVRAVSLGVREGGGWKG